MLRPAAAAVVPTPAVAVVRASPRLCHLARPLSTAAPARSHVGSAPIPLPSSVSFVPPPRPSSLARVRGPKGELAVDIASFVRLDVAPAPAPDSSSSSSPVARNLLRVAVDDSAVKHQRAVWGLTRSLLANAVVGVSDGYTLPLRLVGVGYRATVEDVPAARPDGSPPAQRLNLKLGFAHPVLIDLPGDVRATTPSPNSILLAGIDKQRVGQVAARIRSWRVPEPYNGKGIFVGDEQVRRKEVKKK
ncbi:putative ribosomal protein L6 [Rhodotorula diobovata]|uniref:Putative ribosomal protein L6 n=1 Tax=Rhodotorula diobovata TaxID=5288 RepID=A0A5C5FQH8_9BASI|nr:putative ribosomal protein L6 [Rhodotorula diobovata]